MKFRMINSKSYPFNFKIELIEYTLQDLLDVHNWLQECKIPHRKTGNATALYLQDREASIFALKWS